MSTIESLSRRERQLFQLLVLRHRLLDDQEAMTDVDGARPENR
jgi:hypothetical protein